MSLLSYYYNCANHSPYNSKPILWPASLHLSCSRYRYRTVHYSFHPIPTSYWVRYDLFGSVLAEVANEYQYRSSMSMGGSITYLWKNWPNRPGLACWSDMLARRSAWSVPRFCSWRLAKAGMKPELCDDVLVLNGDEGEVHWTRQDAGG